MKTFATMVTLAAALLAAGTAWADPYPYEILKFQQLPLNGLDLNGDGVPDGYWGHDEISTAWGTGISPTAPAQYQGVSMADDFADKAIRGLDKQPVVHVRWWGSYPRWDETQPVDKFLIVFESDVPARPDQPFSHPGTVLASQVVFRSPVPPTTPAPGTFTEKVVGPGGPPLFETLYEYNAELHPNCWFPEDPDTVYWLKIVALVDVPAGTAPLTAWGWHDRDWTVPDPYASVPPAVVPGEHIQGGVVVPGTETIPVWHFQDDAVSSTVGVVIFPPEWCNVTVVQEGYLPQHYLDDIDGPPGIGQYSKDLAFELYTIPEPATLVLVVAGGLTALLRRRR